MVRHLTHLAVLGAALHLGTAEAEAGLFSGLFGGSHGSHGSSGGSNGSDGSHGSSGGSSSGSHGSSGGSHASSGGSHGGSTGWLGSYGGSYGSAHSYYGSYGASVGHANHGSYGSSYGGSYGSSYGSYGSSYGSSYGGSYGSYGSSYGSSYGGSHGTYYRKSSYGSHGSSHGSHGSSHSSSGSHGGSHGSHHSSHGGSHGAHHGGHAVESHHAEFQRVRTPQPVVAVKRQRATVVVRVPDESVKVFFENTPIELDGTETEFVTPMLVEGRQYHYTIRVESGDESYEAKADVQAGAELVVQAVVEAEGLALKVGEKEVEEVASAGVPTRP